MSMMKVDELKKLCFKIMKALGASDAEASTVTDVLVEADLRGVSTHGVKLLPVYAKRVQHGLMRTRSKIRVVHDSASTALIDGDHGFGQVVGVRAMETAIEKAKESGIGLTGVFNTNHIGMAAYYSMMALNHDMIGIVTSNAAAVMAPWGGRERLLSNTPVSFAIPAGKEKPVVLDMATSVVAGGKIIAAKARNEKIPEGWALDESGRPTTDPAAVFGEAGWIGALLPIGGYKGYGLSLIFDLLCTALTGADLSAQISSMWDFSKPWNAGNIMMVIDIQKLVPVNLFKERVDRLIKVIKNSQKAVGIAEIFIPGEIEFREKERRLREGVPIDENVLRELNSLAKIVQ